MLARADVVLATIPLLAVSGLVLRSIVTTVGVGTGLLAVPLGPVGYLLAFGFVCWELFVGPTPRGVTENGGDGGDASDEGGGSDGGDDADERS